MRATWVPRSRGRELPVGGLVVVAIVGAGCAPSMIRDYAIRKHELVIADSHTTDSVRGPHLADHRLGPRLPGSGTAPALGAPAPPAASSSPC